MSERKDISYVTVRPLAILTGSYVAGTVIENCEKYNSLLLKINFTIGSLTDAQVKIEVSKDGTNYETLTVDAFTGGLNVPAALIYKFAASANMSTKPIEILTKYIKISAIGTGTATGSALAIDAVLGNI